MIQDRAVEAAARAIYERKFGAEGWEGLPDKPRNQYADEARFILEAAAPYMGREVQWGVRDIVSLYIAGHPSEGSARARAAEHPEWCEVVSRPMPGPWTAAR